MILFINACVREDSRTRRLADAVLFGKQPVTELRLEDLKFPVVDEEFLIERDRLIAAGKYDDPTFDLARQFAAADEIVIAAPYWDLSFPAALKQYFEQINVIGITFRYTAEGTPVGLCRAKTLTYVTTAGGTFVPEEYGFGYVKALAENFYGIPDVRLVKATGFDIAGADVEAILREAETAARTMDFKEAVRWFAEKWIEKFRDPDISYLELVDHYMADDCRALGFEMDCAQAFSEKYEVAFHDLKALRDVIQEISDIPLLGSAVYSKWRYFNHWSYSAAEILQPENREWFTVVLEQMKILACI